MLELELEEERAEDDAIVLEVCAEVEEEKAVAELWIEDIVDDGEADPLEVVVTIGEDVVAEEEDDSPEAALVDKAIVLLEDGRVRSELLEDEDDNTDGSELRIVEELVGTTLGSKDIVLVVDDVEED